MPLLMLFSVSITPPFSAFSVYAADAAAIFAAAASWLISFSLLRRCRHSRCFIFASHDAFSILI
jgi:hypothetical protein